MGNAVLLVLATVFAVVTGSNDGGALLSTGLKFPSLRMMPAVAILASSLAVVPLLVGAGVAATFAHKLAPLGGAHGSLGVAIAMVTAVGVVAVLSWRGLPTSLTLAVIGGVAGAGLGLGLPVNWQLGATVLAVSMAAPFVGGLAAHGLLRLACWSRLRLTDRSLAATHRVAFAVQCFAYSANDGQKALAVFAVAGGAAGSVVPPLPVLALIALAFGVGVVLGLPKVSRSLGDRILPVDPFHAVSAELAAGGVVLATAFFGMPVSMTQSLAGGLVGAGLTHSYRRIRWRAALTIVLAWLCTLPTTVGLAAVAGLLARWALG